MQIILVLFRAFDKDCKEFFTNESDEEIHAYLLNICETYVACRILKFEQHEFLPVSKLDNLPRPEGKQKY